VKSDNNNRLFSEVKGRITSESERTEVTDTTWVTHPHTKSDSSPIMAVVGIDIGDHSTYISLARQGGVDTIANDYTQRATPTVVALGGKQRFMGVSAENQRNLTVKNTVSYFKNFLGRNFKDEYVQKEMGRVGAEVVEMEDGRVGFKVQGDVYRAEQILAMMFTKVKDIVRQDQGEEIATCVVSVPLHFTETQRSAVQDAATIAGLPLTQIMNDTSALALAYGKTKAEELPEEENRPRYVVLVDIGASGLQSSLVGVSKKKAVVLSTSCSSNTGGGGFDKALMTQLVTEIEAKYKIKLAGNAKALNKLRISVEKVKKQMSANSNKLPLTIDSLIEDIDVSMFVDRASFEQLIREQLEEVRTTLLNLLQSTTVRREQLHSVELVGGSSRIPAIKQIVQEVFGLSPTSSLNADEGVSKGCGLQAAGLSDKFRTKEFTVQEVISNAVEAVYGRQGMQEKVLIFDEGDSAATERMISVRTDLPVSIALQYSETVAVENKFISLYQIESEEAKNADLELVFILNKNGMIKLDKVHLLTKEENKRRRTSESDGMETSMVDLKFTETRLGGLPGEVVTNLVAAEGTMMQQDITEVARQEAKNMLEEQLYKYRAQVVEDAGQIEQEEAFKQIKEYFDQTENWLYEEGEDAPKQTYEGILKSFHEKMNVYQMWKAKYMQMKAKEEEKRRFMEVQEKQGSPHQVRGHHGQQQHHQPQQHHHQQPQQQHHQQQQQQYHQQPQQQNNPHSRQIPVVYEGGSPYMRNNHQDPNNSQPRQEAVVGDHGYSRPNQPDNNGYHPRHNHPNSGFVRPPPQPDNGYPRQNHPDSGGFIRPSQENMYSMPNQPNTGYDQSGHPEHGYSRPGQPDPFFDGQSRAQRLRRSQLPEDPFNGFGRSSFFNDPLFGW